MLRVHHQKFRGDFSGAQPKSLLPAAYRRALCLAMRAQNKTCSLSMKREKLQLWTAANIRILNGETVPSRKKLKHSPLKYNIPKQVCHKRKIYHFFVVRLAKSS